MTKIVACPIRSPSTLMLRVWCPKPWGIPPADPPTGRGHPQATSTIIITMVTTAIGVHPRRPRVAVVKWLMCLIILASMWIRPWWTQICDPLIVSIQLLIINENCLIKRVKEAVFAPHEKNLIGKRIVSASLIAYYFNIQKLTKKGI